jgi:phosphate transport system protein
VANVAGRFTLHFGGAEASDDLVDDEVIEGLERIDREIIQLFALVGEGVAGATHSLLAGDREAARVLAESDEMIDTLYREVEELAQRQLALRAAGPDELRYLVVVLRMLPELERSGDLAEHVARRAGRGLGVELSPRARGLVEQMGEVACDMWRATADAYADRTPDVADHVESLDDEVDELHVMLTAEIASGSMSLPVAIEAALVARFYERLADHAFNIARRVIYLAGHAPGRDFAHPRLRRKNTACLQILLAHEHVDRPET